LLLALLLLLAGVAAAEDTTQICLKAIEELQSAIETGTDWDTRYAAYKRAKELKEGDEACEAAYQAIQPLVADGLRREDVPLSGWLMGLFGGALLWGGMTVCIIIAIRSGKSGTEAD
jgi:hypothetical protein